MKQVVSNEQPRFEEGSDWFQILAIFFSCLSALSAGILFAWSSPSIPNIIADKINYNITLAEASYFTVLPPIGAICSCLIYSKLNDWIGRKLTLLSIAIPHITAWVLIATCTSIYPLYAARFITGLADACLFASLPIYVGEVATPKIRGTWGNLMTLFIYLGELVANIIGSYFSVQLTAKICLVIPVIFTCGFVFMPETPYFYLMKDRVEDARSSLRKLRRKEDVEEELSILRSDVKRQMSESGTWKDLFTVDSNRRAIYAGVFLRASQQLGGIASFTVYTQYIFAKSHTNLSASSSAIIFIALIAVFNFCAGLVLDKVGRRLSYFLSLLSCGVVLLCEATYFFVEQFYPGISLEAVTWIPLAGMIVFVVCYSFGLGIVPTLMLGELFSASIKGKGLCVLNIVFGVLVSSTTKLFHVFDTEFGLFAPFLFFSMSCFISSVLTLYFVPETKGKTLEEIQQDLKGKTKANKNYQG